MFETTTVKKHARIQREENHKTLGFLSNTGLDPLQNSQNYQASIQCRADDGSKIVIY